MIKYSYLVILFLCFTSEYNSQSNIINDNCEGAILIVNNTNIKGEINLVGFEEFSCINEPNKKLNGIWYKYTGKNKILNLNYNSETIETRHAFFLGGCRIFNFCTPEYNRNIFVENGEELLIFIYKEPFLLRPAKFDISFSEFSAVNYSRCESRPTLNCQEKLTFNVDQYLSSPYLCDVASTKAGWFKIVGDDKIRTLNISQGESNQSLRLYLHPDACSSQNCLPIELVNGTFSFLAIKNKEYNFSVTSDNFIDKEIRISNTCEENTSELFTCKNIPKLECDKEITIKYNDKQLSDIIVSSFPSYWVKVEGDGFIKNIQFSHDNPLSTVQMSIFEISNSDTSDFCSKSINIKPIVVPIFDNQTYSLNAHREKAYYLNLHMPIEGTRLKQVCTDLPAVNNSTCDAAFYLDCNSKGNSNGNYGWFDLDTTSTFLELRQLNKNFYGTINIFEGTCASPRLVLSKIMNPVLVDNLKIKKKRGQKLKVQINNFSGEYNILENNCLLGQQDAGSYCDFSINIEIDKSVKVQSSIPSHIDLSTAICTLENDSKWYSVIGTGDTLQVQNEDENIITFLHKGNCDTLLCMGGTSSTSKRLSFVAEKNTPYFINATKNIFGLDASFKIVKARIANNNDCRNAESLPCIDSTNLVINFAQYITTNEVSDCSPNQKSAWYKIIGNNNYIKIKTNISPSLTISILSGSCGQTKCLVNSLGSTNFFAEIGKDYYLKISSTQNLTEIVDVFCTKAKDDLSCNTSTFVTCGNQFELDFKDAVLYPNTSPYTGFKYKRFMGDGSFLSFSDQSISGSIKTGYRFYNEKCDTLIYEDQNAISINHINGFKTTKGKIYNIRFENSPFSSLKPTPICIFDEGANTNCENARKISCGEKLTYSTKNKLDYTLKGTYFKLFNTAWYEIIGDNNLVKVSTLTNGAQSYIFKSKNNCEELEPHPEYEIKFLEKGVKYFIIIYTKLETTNIDSLDFNIECLDRKGDICQRSIELLPNESKIIEVLGGVNSFGSCTIEESGIWLKITGKNGYFGLSLQEIRDLRIFVGEGTCDSIKCLYENTNPYFNFKGEAGKIYFIKLATSEIYFKNVISLLFEESVTNFYCNNSLQINCGKTFSGAFANLPIDKENVCKDISPGLYYKYKGDGNFLKINIEKLSAQKMSLKVFENDCTSGRCLYEVNDLSIISTFVIDTRKNVNYYLKFSSNVDGVFQAIAECYEPPENVDCNTANYLVCNDTIKIELSTPLGVSNSFNCTEKNLLHHWYKLPRGIGVYEIDLLNTSTSSQYNIVLVKGNCIEYKCIGFADQSDNKKLFNIVDESEYYIIISSPLKSIKNKFEFVFRCKNLVSNDNCETPLNISCGDKIILSFDFASLPSKLPPYCGETPSRDLWYKITGNGNLITLEIDSFDEDADIRHLLTLYEKANCDSLKCLNQTLSSNSIFNNVFTFYSEVGKEYLINLGLYSSEMSNIKINVKCSEPIGNSTRQGAVKIERDTTIIVNTSKLTWSKLPTECITSHKGGVWYKIEGNDSVVTIGANFLKFIILKDVSNSLRCEPSRRIYMKKGETYFIYVFTNLINFGDPNLSIKFEKKLQNDFCTTPEQISCGSQIEYSLDRVTLDPRMENCVNYIDYSAFFTIEGNNEIISLSTEPHATLSSFSIMDSCTGKCLFSNRRPANLVEFMTFKNKKYLLALNHQDVSDLTFKGSLNCKDVVQLNQSKGTAELLECRKYKLNPLRTSIDVEDCEGGEFAKFWYKLPTAGERLFIRRKYVESLVYSVVDDNCNKIYEFSSADDNMVFLTPGKTYYMVIKVLKYLQVPETSEFSVIDKCEAPTNTYDQDKFIVKLIPNPSSDFVNLQIYGHDNENANVKIFRMNGTLVSNIDIIVENGGNKIQLENLNNGIYYLELFLSKRKEIIKMVKIN